MGHTLVMALLFTPLTLRGRTFRNRAWISPMCQYSSHEGRPDPWHLVHLGGFAKGGAGLVVAEATAVTPEGRITPACAGIWNDQQAEDYAPIVEFIHRQGAAAGIQLAHAGRKASTQVPWQGGGALAPAEGGWGTLAPSALPFGRLAPPAAMTVRQIDQVVAAWAQAARRAVAAGFDVIEVHAAHGYLLHEFLSPLSNRRGDAYGGDLVNRARLLLRVVDSIREAIPEDVPLFVRVSATDWVPGGWDLADTVQLAGWLGERGTDLIDTSSGALSPEQRIPVGPGYQVPLAAAIRQQAGIPTSAVGLILSGAQAEDVLQRGAADAVMIGRAALRQPAWALQAAQELQVAGPWPRQYERAAGPPPPAEEPPAPPKRT